MPIQKLSKKSTLGLFILKHLGLESDDLFSRPFSINRNWQTFFSKLYYCLSASEDYINKPKKMVRLSHSNQPEFVSTESNLNSFCFPPLHPFSNLLMYMVYCSKRMGYTRDVLGRTEWTDWAASLVNIYATELTLNICSATRQTFYRF